MGPKGAVEILYRRELAEAEDPAARAAELEEEFRDYLFADTADPPRVTRTQNRIWTRIKTGT